MISSAVVYPSHVPILKSGLIVVVVVVVLLLLLLLLLLILLILQQAKEDEQKRWVCALWCGTESATL